MAILSRRNLLLGAAAAGGLWWLKPGDEGEPYSSYFDNLNVALKTNKVGWPRMLIDLDRVDANIAALRKSITGKKTWRVVVKSLPSIELLRYVMEKGNTNALMVFHQPFLNQLAAEFPVADMLLGKPLPVAGVESFYNALSNTSFQPEKQLQWLIDTKTRLSEYQELARDKGLRLRVNLELDVGLHRGGFDSTEAVVAAVSQIAQDQEHLEFAGFMGYEAFIAKMPGLESSLAAVKEKYHAFVNAAREAHPDLFHEGITYNIAGSPTYKLYEDDTFFDDISAGSGVVMPTDFDIPTLETHQPAAYIATPILKKYDSVVLPGAEFAAPLFSAWNPNRQQAFYIYGGNWLATYENPQGLTNNPIWGHSSNQEMVNASDKVTLDVGDFVFLRPHQSEFVFLQFGDLLAMRNGKIENQWPVLGAATS